MNARDVVLDRIRTALSDVPTSGTPDDVDIDHVYRGRAASPGDDLVEVFAERLEEYKATVGRVVREEIRAAVADVCRRMGIRCIVVPPAYETSWIPRGVEVLHDASLTKENLATSDAVLTGCRLAIAQTGTIVLDGGPDQGRRALSLVPDFHLCVVRADQIVATVPEAIEALEDDMRAAPRNLTLISGPSATSDIEFRRVEGVHGPRTLEVLVVRDG